MTQEQQTQLAQLEETIRVAQQQIEELKNSKPKKFEWDYNSPTYVLHSYGYAINSIKENEIEHGRYRLTKEVAEQSLARNKRANRLEALAEQLGSKSYPWGSAGILYCVYQNYDCTYKVGYTDGDLQPEVVYMEEDVAYEICRMLNAGEFSLEGEL